MRSISRGAFLALLSTLALSAVVVSSAAAALPEFQKEGKPLAENVKFTGTGEKSEWEANAGVSYFPRSSTATGEITGPKAMSGVVLTFTQMNKNMCVTNKEQTLITNSLKGTIGFPTNQSGVALLLEGATSAFASCTIDGPLTGSLIGKISPLNTPTTKFELTYEQTAGYQRIEKLTNAEAGHHLGIPIREWQIGVEATEILTTSKPIELKE